MSKKESEPPRDLELLVRRIAAVEVRLNASGAISAEVQWAWGRSPCVPKVLIRANCARTPMEPPS